MNNQTKLEPLVAQLQRCESRNSEALRQTVSESWDNLRRDGIGESNQPSRAVIAAIVINSNVVAQLLTAEEQGHLLRLADLALERYEQRTNPTNKLGKVIAGIVKDL